MNPKTEPLFSVVIPTFNRGRFVAHAIDSIRRQTERDFEMIVVDDGSTDDTAAVLGRYGDQIEVVTQANQGVSAARNAGVARARGRWLAFLDSDDEWQRTYLAAQRRHLEAADVPVAIQCTDSLVDSEGGAQRRYFELNGVLRSMGSRGEMVVPNAFAFVVRHAPWQLGSVVVDAEAFRRTGGFNTRLRISEDMELMARVASFGAMRLIAQPLVHVRRRLEATEALTLAAARQQLQTRETHDRIWSELATIGTLRARDQWHLRVLRSANKRALGNLLAQRGDRKEALRAYSDAVRLTPTPKSIGKLLVSLVRP